MNLPNLPTDNLYKFMSLSGLLIIGIYFYFSWTASFEIEQKLIEMNEATEIWIQKLKTQKDKRDELHFEYLSNEANAQKIELLMKRRQLLKDINIYVYTIGGLLVGVGFYFWYIKVQRPADIAASKIYSD